MKQTQSRRFFLQHCASTSLLLISGGFLLTHCDSPKTTRTDQTEKPAANPCEDYSGVSAEDIKKRTELGYVTQSPIPDKLCSSCNLWLPPAPGKECGGCMLFKGPVYASAHCTYWAPQVSS
ncbi:high-potential iron-sulfur protein [Larkinella bovis]|uniref:High-potential iron-sulfur protein n=1 Tax=Larkinella bovis TaxID=683041 RepID=A0ABW0IHY9_9BACT